jgi:hypothetical protein
MSAIAPIATSNYFGSLDSEFSDDELQGIFVRDKTPPTPGRVTNRDFPHLGSPRSSGGSVSVAQGGPGLSGLGEKRTTRVYREYNAKETAINVANAAADAAAAAANGSQDKKTELDRLVDFGRQGQGFLRQTTEQLDAGAKKMCTGLNYISKTHSLRQYNQNDSQAYLHAFGMRFNLLAKRAVKTNEDVLELFRDAIRDMLGNKGRVFTEEDVEEWLAEILNEFESVGMHKYVNVSKSLTLGQAWGPLMKCFVLLMNEEDDKGDFSKVHWCEATEGILEKLNRLTPVSARAPKGSQNSKRGRDEDGEDDEPKAKRGRGSGEPKEKKPKEKKPMTTEVKEQLKTMKASRTPEEKKEANEAKKQRKQEKLNKMSDEDRAKFIADEAAAKAAKKEEKAEKKRLEKEETKKQKDAEAEKKAEELERTRADLNVVGEQVKEAAAKAAAEEEKAKAAEAALEAQQKATQALQEQVAALMAQLAAQAAPQVAPQEAVETVETGKKGRKRQASEPQDGTKRATRTRKGDAGSAK